VSTGRSRDPLADPGALLKRVYAYVASRVGAGPDADDITSATFERAVRYRARFDARKGDPAAWMVGIARRVIADHVSNADGSAASEPTQDATPDHAETAHMRIDLERALATLPDRDRDLIAMRYRADLSSRQIGKLLGISTGAVDVALHRAIGRLRRALEGKPET